MYTLNGHKPAQSKVTVIVEMPPPKLQETSTVLYRNGKLLIQVFCPLV